MPILICMKMTLSAVLHNNNNNNNDAHCSRLLAAITLS